MMIGEKVRGDGHADIGEFGSVAGSTLTAPSALVPAVPKVTVVFPLPTARRPSRKGRAIARRESLLGQLGSEPLLTPRKAKNRYDAARQKWPGMLNRWPFAQAEQ
jgi:hypothetical protein